MGYKPRNKMIAGRSTRHSLLFRLLGALAFLVLGVLLRIVVCCFAAPSPNSERTSGAKEKRRPLFLFLHR